jgi:hypothetical protein
MIQTPDKFSFMQRDAMIGAWNMHVIIVACGSRGKINVPLRHWQRGADLSSRA